MLTPRVCFPPFHVISFPFLPFAPLHTLWLLHYSPKTPLLTCASVSNTLKVLNITTGPETQTTLVAGEVGQKFPTEGTLDSVGKMEHPEVMVDGLYNFAKLAGALEEMVGLPGISVGSRVPQVGDENVNGGLGK